MKIKKQWGFRALCDAIVLTALCAMLPTHTVDEVIAIWEPNDEEAKS
jgi:hypothetical protein